MPENNTTTEEGAKAIEPINPATEQSASAPAEEDVLSSPPVDDSINKIDSNELTPEPDTSAGSAQDTSAGSAPDISTSLAEHEQAVAPMAEPLMEEKIETEMIATVPTAEQPAESASPTNEPIAVATATPIEKPTEQIISPPLSAPDIIPPAQTQTPIAQTAPAPQNFSSPAEPIEHEISKEKLEENFNQRLLNNLVEARRKRRQSQTDNLGKILGYFSGADKITNNKVKDLLKASNRSAARYLGTLFKQGEVMRFGKTKSIFYQKYS